MDENLRGVRGPDGKIPLWIESENKWVRVWAPDAREMIANGTGSFDGPADVPAPKPARQPRSARVMTTKGEVLEKDED